MTAPNLASSGSSVWNTTATPKTQSVTVAAGDWILVKATSEDGGTGTIATPTGGTGLTWTLLQSYAASNNSGLWVWVTQSATAQSFTLSVTSSSGGFWGYTWGVWNGTAGIVSSVKAQGTGVPSTSITTAWANSALSIIVSDWAAVVATATYPTVNGSAPSITGGYPGDGAHYGTYSYYYADAGAAGSKTVGMTTPTGQKYSMVVVEILASDAPPIIALRAAGTATSATALVTAINPAVPAGVLATDLSVLTVWMKPFGTTITTPSGWTKIGEATNGTVAGGADTGSTKIAVFVKESATVGAIGNLTLGGSPDSVGAVINTYSKTSGTWDYSQFTTGGDTTNGANYAATGAAGIGVAAGDWITASTAVNGDIGTPSAWVIAGMSGATLDTTVNRTNAAVTTGNDTRGLVSDIPVTAGSSSAAPTYAYTNASSTSGTTLWLRLRATAGDFSGTATISSTGSVTASGVVGKVATATVSSTGSVTSTGSVSGGGVSASATISSAGSVAGTGATGAVTGASVGSAGSATGAGVVGKAIGATVASAGSVSASGSVQTTASVSISSAGSVSASGVVGLSTGATVSSAGGVSASGVVGVSASATISSAGGLTSTGAVVASGSGSATISSAGSVTATGRVDSTASVSISSGGGVSASGVVGKVASASISSAGGLTVTGSVTAAGTATATISSTGGLSASGVVGVFGSASVSSVGGVNASASVGLYGSASIASAGSVGTTVNQLGKTATSSVITLGLITSSGTVVSGSGASASIIGTLTMTVTGRVDSRSATSISGLGLVSATGVVGKFASASISGTGSVTVSGIVHGGERDITIIFVGPYPKDFSVSTPVGKNLSVEAPAGRSLSVQAPVGKNLTVDAPWTAKLDFYGPIGD